MASITSHPGGQRLLTEINATPDLDNYAIDNSFVFILAPAPLTGSPSGDGVVEIINLPFDGVLETTFRDLYYNRIHVIEKHTQLGNVTANQTRIIEVWNAYFVEQTLDGFSNTGDITVTGFEDGVFNALQSHLYTVEIPLEGAPTIDDVITWVFEVLGDRIGTIQGQRVIPFLLRHNWIEKVLEQVAYLTDVIPALSGKEQRIGLRSTPRRRFEMSYMTLTPLERSYLENVLYGWQARRYAVPLWSDVTPLRSAVESDTNVLDVDTSTRDFEIGALVFVTDGTNHDTLEIIGVDADSVTTKTNLRNAYGIGARVVPARLGTLETKVDASRITSDLETIRLAWALTAEQVSTTRLEDYTVPTYRGLELFNVSNDYTDAIAVTQDFKVDTMDASVGASANYASDSFPRRTYPFSQLLIREELGRFLKFMANRLGRLNPFWFVERVPSFFLEADTLGDDVTFIVTTGGYTQQSFASPARRDIAIKTNAGWKYRRITGSSVNIDGTETITLDTALGVDLVKTDKPLMSYVKCVRLSQDQFELSYTSTGAITTATAFIDLLTN